MLIIDGHLDLAWNALQWNRNLQHSVYTIRTEESRLSGAGRGQGTVALPEMREGRIALCFATLLARSTGRQLELVKPEGDELASRLGEGLRQVRASTGGGAVCTVVEVAPWSRIPEQRALLVARDE